MEEIHNKSLQELSQLKIKKVMWTEGGLKFMLSDGQECGELYLGRINGMPESYTFESS
jgi:hypothetical protein